MHLHQSSQPNIPQTLVGITFENAFRAQEFLVAASGLAAAGKLKLKDAVTVVRDTSGKTVVHETIDPTPARAALSGAMWARPPGSPVQSSCTPTSTTRPSNESETRSQTTYRRHRAATDRQCRVLIARPSGL